LAPLAGHLTAVEAAAGAEDSLVSSLLSSVDATSAGRGVYTQAALVARYDNVATVARQVAGVPEGGASVLRYLLARAQAYLLLTPKALAPPSPDEPVDIHSLTGFDVIDNANACIHVGDLLGAVRWLSQLSGEARIAVQDWCDEARRSLAVVQLAEVLVAHATANTASAAL